MATTLSDVEPMRQRSLVVEDGFVREDYSQQHAMSSGNDLHEKGAVEETHARYPSSETSDETFTAGTFKRDPTLTKYYKPIDNYEGAHRYDPDFQWDPKEEQRLVRKVR